MSELMGEGAMQDHLWSLLQPYSDPARKRIVGSLQGRLLETDMLLHQDDWLRQREAYLRELELRWCCVRHHGEGVELC